MPRLREMLFRTKNFSFRKDTQKSLRISYKIQDSHCKRSVLSNDSNGVSAWAAVASAAVDDDWDILPWNS